MLIIDPIPLPSDLPAGLLAVLIVAIVVGVAIVTGGWRVARSGGRQNVRKSTQTASLAWRAERTGCQPTGSQATFYGHDNHRSQRPDRRDVADKRARRRAVPPPGQAGARSRRRSGKARAATRGGRDVGRRSRIAERGQARLPLSAVGRRHCAASPFARGWLDRHYVPQPAHAHANPPSREVGPQVASRKPTRPAPNPVIGRWCSPSLKALADTQRSVS